MATGRMVAVFSMGGIDCARSTPAGAATGTAGVHPLVSKPGDAQPDWTNRASYVSLWTLSAVVGPSAVSQPVSLSTRAERPSAYRTSSWNLTSGCAGCHGTAAGMLKWSALPAHQP